MSATISTVSNGDENLIYEDSSCKVVCNVSDFRDTTWWVTILEVYDKEKNRPILLTNKKLMEAYQRITSEVNKQGMKEIYTTKFGFIRVVKDISYEKPLL